MPGLCQRDRIPVKAQEHVGPEPGAFVGAPAARDVAAQLGVSLSTLYAYVDARGQPRPRAAELLVKRPGKAEKA